MVSEYYVHNFDGVLFTIFGRPVYFYGFVYMFSVLFFPVFLRKISLYSGDRFSRGSFHGSLHGLFSRSLGKFYRSLTSRFLDNLIFYILLGLILGGRLGFVLFYQFDYYWDNPLAIIDIRDGGIRGMSFHGAFLGLALAVLLASRRYGVDLLHFADHTCLFGTLCLFFGRLANFFNGELWGIPTAVPWAVVFPLVDNLPRHPSQLYEALLEGLLLSLVLLTFAFGRFNYILRPGVILSLFLLGYSLARILAEQFREPDSFLGYYFASGDVFFSVTHGVILSLPMFFTGLGLLYFFMKLSSKGS